MKKVVYTAIFGGFDEIKTPLVVSEDWDFVFFTDDPSLKSDVWDVRLIDSHGLSLMGAVRTDEPRALGKFIKMKPHVLFPDCDESLWIDGSFLITGDINGFISKYSRGSDLLGFKHNTRDCIYEEAKAVVGLKYASKNEVDSQIKKYRDDGYPEHNGLITCGILYRKHTEKLIRLMDFWYKETMRETLRDQLSFDYLAWKSGFTYDSISERTIYANDYFRFNVHKVQTFLAKLYLKTRNIPFAAGTEITRTVVVTNRRIEFEISFEIEEQDTGFTDLRFVPCELHSRIKIASATVTDTDGGIYPLEFLWASGDKEKDGYVFETKKPMFFYKIKNKDAKIRVVVFTGEIYFPTDETGERKGEKK